MGVHEDVGIGAVLHQPSKRREPRPPLFGPRVQLAIGVRACATFAEAIIGLRIHRPMSDELHQVPPALAHRLAALENNGAHSPLDEAQRTVQSGRTRSHHNGFRGVRHGLPPPGLNRDRPHIEAHFHLEQCRPFPGIQTPPQHRPRLEVRGLLTHRPLNRLWV